MNILKESVLLQGDLLPFLLPKAAEKPLRGVEILKHRFLNFAPVRRYNFGRMIRHVGSHLHQDAEEEKNDDINNTS